MEVVGKVKLVNDEQVVSASFKKRELVVTTDEQYPQHIIIEFKQDKTDLLSSYKVGENVKVGINLRGREWINPQGEARYFNSIEGWKIERLQADARQTPSMPAKETFAPATNYNEDEPDDLPF